MSAYKERKTNLNNSKDLVLALEALGFQPQCHEVAQPLVGYQGDKRTQTAEIIIPRKQVGGASNDIGFKKQADGSYVAVISDYDSSRYNDKWLAEVRTRALESKAKRIARQHETWDTCTREVLPSGKVRLHFVKNG